ncbi:MAG: hypothetical protein GEV06_16750 [Luteitalea sp.]|nr:hypothetical protein [Luteitalea sp.]
MTATYTLTTTEAREYDSGDDERAQRVISSLRDRYGREANRTGNGVTEIRHPSGYTIGHYRHD